MPTPDREWADVYIENGDWRSRLETRALYYIPIAAELARKHKQSKSKLASRSAIAKHDLKLDLPGKLVIDNILECEKPVSYDSAASFITLINLVVPENEQLSTRNIVACVFRLRDTHVLGPLSVTARIIADGTGVREPIVRVAIATTERFRICFNDAWKIWEFLLKFKEGHRPDGFSDDDEGKALKEKWDHLDRVLSDDPLTFIITDVSSRHPLEVGKVGEISPDDRQERYVYYRNELQPAPASGHPWALDLPSSVNP